MKKTFKFLGIVYLMAQGSLWAAQNPNSSYVAVSRRQKENSTHSLGANPTHFSLRGHRYSNPNKKEKPGPSGLNEISESQSLEMLCSNTRDQSARLSLFSEQWKKEYNLNNSISFEDKPELFLSFLVSQKLATVEDIQAMIAQVTANSKEFILKIDYRQQYKVKLERAKTPKKLDTHNLYASDPKMQYIFQIMLEERLKEVEKILLMAS